MATRTPHVFFCLINLPLVAVIMQGRFHLALPSASLSDLSGSPRSSSVTGTEDATPPQPRATLHAVATIKFRRSKWQRQGKNKNPEIFPQVTNQDGQKPHVKKSQVTKESQETPKAFTVKPKAVCLKNDCSKYVNVYFSVKISV